jgi:dihydroxyacetone kinase
MSTKKLVNDPSRVVQECIRGVTSTHLHLKQLIVSHENQKTELDVVVRADVKQINNVSLISGGGSGHEPAHAMYVGKGMLTAAVCGAVFTSPAIKVILQTIRAVTGPKGCLLIVKNYTGDRLNFGAAAEQARLEGFKVEMIIVGDDCSLKTARKRRGIAGTIFVHKLVGAYVENSPDATLDQVKTFAEWVSAAVSTMGVGLSGCTVPGNVSSSFNLPGNEVELGLGIHGEQGVQRVEMESSDQIVRVLVDNIVQNQFNQSQGKRVALMVNNLGSTTGIELYIVVHTAVQLLQDRGIIIDRIYVGTFMSALDMAGVSLTILNLNRDKNPLGTEQVLSLLDFPTESPSWPPATTITTQSRTNTEFNHHVHESSITEQEEKEQYTDEQELIDYTVKVVRAICEKIIESEKDLTKLDTLVGDGDMGLSFKRGAQLVLERVEPEKIKNVAQLIRTVALAVQEIGGSSGALLSAGILTLAHSLKENRNEQGAKLWSIAMDQGVTAITKLGGAQKGSRTMMDALIPLKDELLECAKRNTTGQELKGKLVKASQDGADSTKDMEPGEGRSGLIEASKIVGNPDPGAVAMAIMVKVWSEQ